jgi:ferrochelatase
MREFILAPIGFVCDHVEILYDVDILFRHYAGERGIRLLRPEALNDSPAFIAALASVVREKLQTA